MSKVRVLHVVPSLNIGGVEVGLLRSHGELQQQIDFSVFSVKGAGRLHVVRVTWRDVLKSIFRKDSRPDVVVTSLWLGHITGLVLALIYGSRWIPFFHAARSEGWWRDAILHSAARLSSFAFFDSQATYKYHEAHGRDMAQIVPYRFESPNFGEPRGTHRPYDCIFVGRIAPPKRPDLLVEYLSHLQAQLPDVKPLVVISCEEKDLEDFHLLLRLKKVAAEVRVNVDPMLVIELLAQSSLYLSFSDSEGFGMATVDAMCNRCVPVVRPVGEIASYVDESCGILVDDISAAGMSDAARRSLALLKDKEMLREFGERAQDSVSSRYRLYIESYVDGVRRALNQI